MTQRGRKRCWRRTRRSSGSRTSSAPSGPSPARLKFKGAARKRRTATRLASHSARCRLALCAMRAVLADAPPAPSAIRLSCVTQAAGGAQSFEMLGSRRTAEAPAPPGALARQDAGPRLRPRRAHHDKQPISRIINEPLGRKKLAQIHQMQTSGNIRSKRSEISVARDEELIDRGKKEKRKTADRLTRYGVESRSLIRKSRTCSIRCPANFTVSSITQPIEGHSHSALTSGRTNRQLAGTSTYAQSMSSAPAPGGVRHPPLGSEIQVIIDRLRQKTERAKDLVAASNKRSSGVGSSQIKLERRMDEMELIKSKSRAHQWRWSVMDKSHECIVSKDRLSLCFHPHCSESTALCRSSEPLRRNGNYYYWEIHVQDKTYGTSVMFGLCTRKQRMHANEYCNLVGLDENGWSVSHKGLAWHQGKSRQFTDMFPENRPVTIGLLYNSMRGELSYFMNGKNLGVAFSGLNQVDADLYPVVGSTAKCTQMRLLGAYCGNMSLLERASFTLLQNSRDPSELLEYLRHFQLPTTLLNELTRIANVSQIPENSADGQTNGPGCGDSKQTTRNLEDNGQLMNDANMSE